MILFQIEVRTIAEEHDVQAHRLAREILNLPLKQLPSLNSRAANQTPLTPPSIRTAQLYHLTGNLNTNQIDRLITNLLVDPVVQEASLAGEPGNYHVVDVFFLPGVTDTLAESVLAGARMLGISGLEHVETGRRYMLDSRLSEADVRSIAQALLYNPVIQQYAFHPAGENKNVGTSGFVPSPGAQGSAPKTMPEETRDDVGNNEAAMGWSPTLSIPPFTSDKRGIDETSRNEARGASSRGFQVPITSMSDQELLAASKKGLLALNLDEMRAIQHHYRQQGREPTDVELETLAQTWSEHCSHKTFKATLHYRELDSDGNLLEEETINGLLKQYIMRATEQVKQPWLVSAFSDNAGIIRFTQTHDIAFKVETHNHPSAIEPFGGANTGVGGVIRDVLGVSAQPIACTDVLCFGPLDTSVEELPAGILPPRRIASGVVNGVRDYGNKMGVPTVNGAILYNEGYLYNPLVFCGCLGMLPHGSHPRKVQPGDRIVVLGGRTGRDGIHGATFSSGEMSSEINAQAGSAVQIGAPITEKKVADVIVQARDRQLYSAITDCGAGGFSSAIGEMGAETGAYVELEKAPLKYHGLAPWEIWLSEAQERMVLAVPPKHIEQLLEICAIEEVEASIIGIFTGDHRLVVTYAGQAVADIDMEFLHEGRPGRSLEAVWTRKTHQWDKIPWAHTSTYMRDDRGATHYAPTLLALLHHPTIASKEAVVRRYDFEVQGATVLKPLVGRAGNGPGDAAVLHPLCINEAWEVSSRHKRGIDETWRNEAWGASSHAFQATLFAEQTNMGIVLSNGLNPLYGKVDPYHMAINAVDEALRNLTAVGGDIERAALLDNFCWGNPNDPLQSGMLVRAVKGCHDASIGFGTPFISGKDSLNNEYRAGGKRLPVIPTLLISAVGVIDDVARTVDMSLKKPGNLLYLVGRTREEMAGSHYAEVVGHDLFEQFFPYAAVPQVDIAHAYDAMKALGAAIRKGLVCSCHDLSEGGLAVALAEMAIAGSLGVRVDLGNLPPCISHKRGIDETWRKEAWGASSHAFQVPPQDIHHNVGNIVRLFSESASRFIVEVTPERWKAFEEHMRTGGVEDVKHLGNVTDTGYVDIYDLDELIYLPVRELQEAWKGGQA